MTSTRSTHAMDVSSQHLSSRSARPQTKRTRADAVHPALRLQRLVGNNAVNGALQRGPAGLPQQTSSGLPAALREGIRSLSGMDLSDVRVHRDSDRPARLSALAFAQGDEIHLGPGQERHLPHEAWHLVQQRQGRVQPSLQMAGMPVNDDAGLEREADRMGQLALGVASQRNATLPEGGPRSTVEAKPARPGAGRAGSASAVLQAFWVRDGDKVEWVDDRYYVEQWYEKSKAGKAPTDESRFTSWGAGGVGWRQWLPGWLPVFRLEPQIKPRIKRHLSDIHGWIDKLGTARMALLLKVFDLTDVSDRKLISKHVDGLAKLDVAVLEGLVARRRNAVHRFLDRVQTGDLGLYLAGSTEQQLRLVQSDRDFRDLMELIGKEAEFGKSQVLSMNPNAAQGAHYLSEHGAHSTPRQTIRRAVEYAIQKGQTNVTKGNWVSFEAEQAALDWARKLAGDTVTSVLLTGTPSESARMHVVISAGQTPIFGETGSPKGQQVYAAVRKVLGIQPAGAPTYQHGNVAGTGDPYKVTVHGDFQHGPGTALKPRAYEGVFNGSLSGDDLALIPGTATPIPWAPLNIEHVEGNGSMQVELDGVARQNVVGVGNQLTGLAVGTVIFDNARVRLMNRNARWFNGTGRFKGMLSAALDPTKSLWAIDSNNLTVGTVDQLLLRDLCGNDLTLKHAELKAAAALPPTANRVGDALTGMATQYVPRMTGTITSNANTRPQALVATVEAKSRHRQSFSPTSLQTILNNPGITGRTDTTYVRYGANNRIESLSAALLMRELTLEGTLANLKANGKLSNVMDLASLNLKVEQVGKDNASALADIDTEVNPVQGTAYKIRVGADWYKFTLSVYSLAPAQGAFKVLLVLRDGLIPAYEPFTAYPV